MKFAVDTTNFGPCADVRLLADMARDADDAGWDGFFIWDHLAMPWPAPFADVTVALAAIALATERIQFGAIVTPLPRRRPWKFARETVSIDHLSDGRLIVGVGLGILSEEFDALGEETDLKRRGEMLDEALDVLTGLWSGAPFSYEGAYYQVKDAHFVPAPIARSDGSNRPPVWVAATWPHTKPLRRAARWDGVAAMPASDDPEAVLTPDQVREIRAIIDDVRPTNAPFEVVVAGTTPGDNAERAAEIVAPYADAGATWWLELVTPLQFESQAEDGSDVVTMMRERIRQGPPSAGGAPFSGRTGDESRPTTV